MAREWVVLTAVGTDRYGLVDDLTKELVRFQCNIEESRMAVLGGEFAVIMLISSENTKSLLSDMASFQEQSGLHIQMKPTVHPSLKSRARPYLIESVSLDNPGIMHEISSLLREFKINIEDLESDTTAAPWTGAPMFQVRIRINLEASISLSDFRERMEELAHERDLDITLKSLVPAGREGV